MTEKRFTCIICPEGCRLTVAGETVTGNRCARGEKYGKMEATDPRRIVTSCVKLQGGGRVPVKTRTAVRKADMQAVIRAIHGASANPPVAIGDIVIKNCADTGIDIVATSNS